MVDASTFCCIDYVVSGLPGNILGSLVYGPWEIRKVGQHLLDLKTMWMALSL